MAKLQGDIYLDDNILIIFIKDPSTIDNYFKIEEEITLEQLAKIKISYHLK